MADGTVATTELGFRQNQDGPFIRFALLKVTSLTGGQAETIAHGLPSTPRVVIPIPLVAAGGFETADADATNIYWTTGSNQTSMKFYVEY